MSEFEVVKKKYRLLQNDEEKSGHLKSELYSLFEFDPVDDIWVELKNIEDLDIEKDSDNHIVVAYGGAIIDDDYHSD